MLDDELRILLSFRLSTPLAYYVEGLETAIRPRRWKGQPLDPKPAPLCLASLLESDRDESVDRPALFRMLKKSAKWNHHKGEDGTPPDISKVIYNLAIVLAMTETGERITDLKDANLVKNFRWLLTRAWLARASGPYLNVDWSSSGRDRQCKWADPGPTRTQVIPAVARFRHPQGLVHMLPRLELGREMWRITPSRSMR